jgi:hypothetical protein
VSKEPFFPVGGVINEYGHYRYGFIDSNGKVVIKLVYEQVTPFVEGLAAVKLLGASNWKYINNECRYEFDTAFRDAREYSTGLALVSGGFGPPVDQGGYYFIDKKGTPSVGNPITGPSFRLAKNFCAQGGMAPFVDSKSVFPYSWGFIGKDGTVKIEPKYTSVSCFSEGLSLVSLHCKPYPNYSPDCIYGFIDTKGVVVIELKFKYASDFSQGLAAVVMSGKTGYIDKKGDQKIPAIFDFAGIFHEDVAAVSINGKWGYINDKGDYVIKPHYDDVQYFSESLAAVCNINENKRRIWGYIDKADNMVIKPQYNEVESFSNGLAAVYVDKDNKAGRDVRKMIMKYIDKTGAVIWTAEKN